jgi:hypothetical protein
MLGVKYIEEVLEEGCSDVVLAWVREVLSAILQMGGSSGV